MVARMASNYPLATVSEVIDDIDNTTDNVNPSVTKDRGSTYENLEGFTLAMQNNDGRDAVYSLRTK